MCEHNYKNEYNPISDQPIRIINCKSVNRINRKKRLLWNFNIFNENLKYDSVLQDNEQHFRNDFVFMTMSPKHKKVRPKKTFRDMPYRNNKPRTLAPEMCGKKKPHKMLVGQQ